MRRIGAAAGVLVLRELERIVEERVGAERRITSIESQFEFILKAWVNNPAFPPAGGAPGEDPILGQAPEPRVRHFAGPASAYPAGPRGPVLTLPNDFIVPTGGGYFFVPSLSALATF